MIGPRTAPTSQIPRGRATGDRIFIIVIAAMLGAVMGAACLLALRNLRTGRADRRGAARLAVFLAAVRLASWLLAAHHSGSPGDEVTSLGNAAADAALAVALLWLNYVALEPYIRRIWPDTLLGWSRVLAGHVRDPRVGLDLLIGILAGSIVTLLQIGRTMILPALGYAAPSAPYGTSLEMLTGPGQIVGGWLEQISFAVGGGSGLVLLAVLLRLLVRPAWLAFSLTSLAFAFLMANELGTTNTPLILVFPLVGGAVLTTALTRYGLLTLVVSLFVFRVLTRVPFVPALSHWTAAPGNWTLAALAVMIAFGLYAARGGKQVFGRLLPE